MRKETKSLLLFTFTLLFLAPCLSACGAENAKEIVSESLNIDVSVAREITFTDSHGGFHGDGTTYIVLKFQDGRILEELKKDRQWKPFPPDADATVTALAYGISDNSSAIGPFTGDIELPEIRSGYYRLIDRQSENDTDILERDSFNYTLAIYDADTKTLYFCEVDT